MRIKMQFEGGVTASVQLLNDPTRRPTATMFQDGDDRYFVWGDGTVRRYKGDAPTSSSCGVWTPVDDAAEWVDAV